MAWNQLNVFKRNGTSVPYSVDKILAAVNKAFTANNEDFPVNVQQQLLSKINIYDGISVEEIQEQVQNALMELGFYKIATDYITYRAAHKELREDEGRLNYMEEYSNSSDNAASSSETDPNSNVSMKNVANLEGEVYKSKNRKLQRRRMYKKLKSMYNKGIADQYIEDLNNHLIYVHDEASTPTLKPYTYSPMESVEVQYNDFHGLMSLKSLYDLVDCPEVCENVEDGVWCKYPHNLKIKDRNKWTVVTRLTKKRRHRDLYRVKTAFGEDIIVTDNHPMIISDDKNDTVQAVDSLGKSMYRLPQQISFDGITQVDLSQCCEYDIVKKNFITQHETNSPYYFTKRYIQINRNLGYIVGFFIGDGNYDNTWNTLMFSQKDKDILVKLSEIFFESFGVVGYESISSSGDKWQLKICSNIVNQFFKKFLNIKDKSENKCLPTNLLMFNEDFAKGIIEGLIDSDGTVNDSSVLIRLSSRECITQLTKLLRYFGYGVSMIHQATPFGNNLKIKSNYDIWGITFTNTPNVVAFDGSYKWQTNITRVVDKSLKYSEGWSTITKVNLITNGSFLNKCEFIYDITTESNTFDCNNLWVHNCGAITTYPLLTDGVGNIDGITPFAPNDIASFSGQITNLVFLISSQLKGAVAVGDYFISLNYYVVKQFGPKWYEKLNDVTTTDSCLQQSNISRDIRKGMKQFIYGINQPAGNRSYNSPFTNVSYYDKYYFKSMFEDYYYPDGTKPEWKALDTLQRMFMELHRELRLIKPLTFPVKSILAA